MPAKIMCAPGDEQLQTVLTQLYGSSNLEIISWQSDKISDMDAIFVAAPIQYAGMLLVNDKVWKKYLAIEYPKVRLITVGLRESKKHSNSIYRPNLPIDIQSIIKEARPCGGDWQPPYSDGLQVHSLLQRFYLGHGSDGYMEDFSRFRRRALIITEKIMNGTPIDEVLGLLHGDEDRPSLKAVWHSVKIRWDNYMPYFVLLPFSDLFENGTQIIQRVELTFQSIPGDLTAFQSSDLLENIIKIENILNKIEQYVEPYHLQNLSG